jgi:glutamyl-tRNA synthetase
MSEKRTMRVRFAPSPTGHLHIGGARTAIFNWLFARHNNGKFLVRVEDTDVERSKKEYVDSILESLEWLGLKPDEPLIYQMARIEEHKKAIDVLLKKGLAYRCFCEPREAAETIENLEKGFASKYDGTCREKTFTQEELKRPHAIRFKLPDDYVSIAFDDLIRKKVTFDLKQLDDFVILRRDGTPTYNFCVVVDDIFMKISHVIRGEDHISNTPKQILIYQALEAKVPEFAHLPLILGESGGKLSKRDAAVSTVEYKKNGFLSDALFNYLVRLGWSHGDQEIFSKQEMIDFFSLEKVGKKGAIFDKKKLLWLNGEYLRKLNLKKFLKSASEIYNDKLTNLTNLWENAILERLFELYRERASTVLELANSMILFASAPVDLDTNLIKKWLTPDTKNLLKEFLDGVGKMEEYDHVRTLELARHICSEHGVKLVALAQPLRLALTGGTTSPGVFELIELLSFPEFEKRVNGLVLVLGG